MASVISSRQTRPTRARTAAAAAGLAAVLLTVTACGSSGNGSSHPGTGSAGSSSITSAAVSQPNGTGTGTTGTPGGFTLVAPPSVKSAGVLKICADIVYPPYTFMQANKPTGIDVDVANALATAMGVSVQWVQTGYVGIFGALQGGKCDAIINGINGEADHDKVMAQIPYLRDTQGFITKKGNPAHIRTLADLSGKSVATQLGSTTAQYLAKLNKQFEAQGKKPMNIETLPQDTAAFAALLSGRVDTYFQDGPVLGYYATKYNDVQVLPLVVNPETVVVGMRKNDTGLINAVTEGIKKMYQLGIMQKIAKKWGDPSSNLLPGMP